MQLEGYSNIFAGGDITSIKEEKSTGAKIIIVTSKIDAVDALKASISTIGNFRED